MIISASYRTDIPAFYGPWLMHRLAAGWAEVRNPYGGPPSRIDLTAPAVDGFVFWTRNLAPFMGYLPEITRLAPFTVTLTITGYPRALEAATPPPERAIATLHHLAQAWGKQRGVWRYDPILLTTFTPASWHRKNFASIARQLNGATDECVVSFATFYAKTRRNLSVAATQHRFDVIEPSVDEKRHLLHDLSEIARAEGMRLSVCAQTELVTPGHIDAARCIDSHRLSMLAGYPIKARTKGNRPGCLCAESRDLGAYDTCPQGCRYCYAVRAPAAAQSACQSHRSDALSLSQPIAGSEGAGRV